MGVLDDGGGAGGSAGAAEDAGAGGGVAAGGSTSSGGHAGSSASGGSSSTGGATGVGGTTTTCTAGATRCQSVTTQQTCDASGSWGTATVCPSGPFGSFVLCCAMDSCGTYSPAVCGMTPTLFTHSDGLGQTWQDDVPLGTYNSAQAVKACATWTGDAKRCNFFTDCANSPEDVLGVDATGVTEYHWSFAGNTAGYVGAEGQCPSPGNTMWD